MFNLEGLYLLDLRFFHSIFALSPTETPSYICPAAIFPTTNCRVIPVFNGVQQRIWWFCKWQKTTHVSLVSASSRTIWTHFEGSAAAPTQANTGPHGKLSSITLPPLRADRSATRQHELFLLIKIHEHVSVFVCLLDSLREQIKTVPTPRNVNARSELISALRNFQRGTHFQ